MDKLGKSLFYTSDCDCDFKDFTPAPKPRKKKFPKRLIGIYSDMKQRCYNPNSAIAKYYYNKGITVDFLSVDDFCDWALNNGYANHLTIDRIDSNKSYSQDNCRWITRSENTRRIDHSHRPAKTKNKWKKEVEKWEPASKEPLTNYQHQILYRYRYEEFVIKFRTLRKSLKNS